MSDLLTMASMSDLPTMASITVGKLLSIVHIQTLWRTFLEELEQLEKMEKASAASEEMLSNVESRPDPLLSVTTGPINPFWDRWFEGPQDSKGCRCWIL
ncbi:guanine nucleotide-binding protein subunit gamma 2 isoform X2 [Quercus suber]|uniref:guanine nucleotide-binding protein subunit gamma 2 isoform X2 n=1 Tax=Quercus suber TaxID=58331 RepID=UPI0032DEE51E